MTLAEVASVVAVVTSLAAMAGLVIEIRNSRLALQTQSLLDLEARFYSAEMVAQRRVAARKLLAGLECNPELEDTLDFLHDVGMLVERGVIDRSLTFEFYKYWIARYWLAAKPYIEHLRKIDDPGTYRKFERLATQIMRRNPDISYTPEAMKEFLMREARLEPEERV